MEAKVDRPRHKHVVGEADIVDHDVLRWVIAGRHDYIKDATKFIGGLIDELIEAESLKCLHDLASVDICGSFEVYAYARTWVSLI